MREHASTPAFCKFKRQLYHSSLSRILESLRPAMKVPETVLFGDNYYRRVIYGLVAYIADYKEQVLLSSILHNWCPKCLAHRSDLNADALRHHQEHADMVIEAYELGELREKYGLVGDLIVSTGSFFVFSD